MAVKTVSIIGGGVAGPALACALAKQNITSTIYELRPGAATIGGAINLSPSALRVLDHFGVFSKAHKIGYSTENIEMYSMSSGKCLGSLPFGSVEKYGYASLRIDRQKLQNLMLEAAVAAGAKVMYGKKLVAVREDEDGDQIVAEFEDGTDAIADVLFGCDGIHSTVRTKYVEPERSPVYTGISTACGYAPVSTVTSPIHFKEMGMNMSGHGSLLTTYSDVEKCTVFLAAVMEVQEEGKDGWQARGKVVEEARKNLLQRFETNSIPCIAEMMKGIEELFFYPVFTLSNEGKWHRGRAMLIGDAAHAMPPGGSSAGLAFEDAILLSRILASSPDNLNEAFRRYDATRRPRVTEHFKQMASRWEGTKNRTWLVQKVREMFVWLFLGFIAKHNDENFGYNPMTVGL